MSTKKQIHKVGWQEQIQMFSSDNRGRKAAVTIEGLTIAKNQVFRDIEFDSVEKGNELIIKLGFLENIFTHAVDALVELHIYQESNGVDTALEVVDEKGRSTLLRLMN